MLDSEVMLMGVGGCCSCSNRISGDFLFPEFDVAGRRGVDGVQRDFNDMLFPEVAAWSGLDSG